MDHSSAVAELRQALPEGVVATAPEAVEKYRYDWTHEATAGTPLAVVRAESAEQVQLAVRWA
ncbi:MAG: FAD-binding oxidoreductase, partial [Nocardioides sp.]